MRNSGSRSGKLMLIGAVAAATVVGGVLGAVVIGPRLGGQRAAAAPESGQTTRDDSHPGEAAADTVAAEKPEAQVVSLGEFLVNLRSAQAVRYLQAEVAVSLTGLPEPKKSHGGGAEEPTLPADEMALVKDRVVAILSAADFQQAQTAAGRQALKKQLAASLAKVLPDYELQEVLFTSFVTQ